MSNMYYSNTVTISKRPNPISAEVPFKFKPNDRINKFEPILTNRRQLSETFQSSGRFYHNPASKSPIMMHKTMEIERSRAFSLTVNLLEKFVSRDSTKLPN